MDCLWTNYPLQCLDNNPFILSGMDFHRRQNPSGSDLLILVSVLAHQALRQIRLGLTPVAIACPRAPSPLSIQDPNFQLIVSKAKPIEFHGWVRADLNVHQTLHNAYVTQKAKTLFRSARTSSDS